MADIRIIRSPISRDALNPIAEEIFGDMVKAVVDIKRGILALGMELHADGEQLLLEDGSKQENLWGINLYTGNSGGDFVEFDSMINIRPSQGNRIRGVESIEIQGRIRNVVAALIQ